MKIAETLHVEGNAFTLAQTHDVTASLERSAMLRSNGLGRFGESEAIGSVPMVLATQWLKEKGLSWDSPREEVRKVLVAKLTDGEFSRLRISNRVRP